MASAGHTTDPEPDTRSALGLGTSVVADDNAAKAAEHVSHRFTATLPQDDAPENATLTAIERPEDETAKLPEPSTPPQGNKAVEMLASTNSPVPPKDPSATADQDGDLIATANQDGDLIAPARFRSAVEGPVCMITLLLASGSRHPYRIDDRYLAKRDVHVPEVTATGQPDPFSISVYTLKELILREWRTEWDAKPSSLTSVRLIHLGKLLEDKQPLHRYRFSADATNVVHMSVRPMFPTDDEEPKGGAKASSSNNRGSGNSCCVIL